jgi:zinc-binding alcohol dehydrogenase family protein
VYYAGSIDRPGTNAQFHLVDERIVGRKPASLTFAEAAALPLTTITAWESLYERFRVSPTSQGTLLILGAAGGVGSMLVQLAAHLTNLTIVGTASRQASRAWATELGAHHVIDHHGDLASRVLDCVPEGVDYIFSPHSEGNIAAYAKVLKPYGHITAIDEPAGLDLLPLKPKSISWHWELMFTRPLLCPQDTAQHDLLNAAATLIDEGAFRTTMTTQLGPINAATMREAHAQIEGSATVGKIVVAGF